MEIEIYIAIIEIGMSLRETEIMDIVGKIGISTTEIDIS